MNPTSLEAGKDAAASGAEAIENAADYLRERDFKQMLADARQIATRHPGAALLAAAALGFVIARNLSRP